MDTEDRGVLPSQRAAKAAESEKAQAELMENVIAAMREDFGRCFGTDHGKRVLAWICERAGFNKSKVAMTAAASVDKDMTTFLAQEEAFYLEIRKYIPINILMEVEYGGIQPSGFVGTGEQHKQQQRGKRK